MFLVELSRRVACGHSGKYKGTGMTVSITHSEQNIVNINVSFLIDIAK